MSRTKSSLLSLTIITVFAVIAAVLLLNRQMIIDQISVWQYQPTAEVANIASTAAFSDNGRFVYYASQPRIESTQLFNDACGRTEQSTAILGCYSSDRIYIYNITNEKLAGIKEVTAAHEMLHAAYQRLSDADKKSVDALTEAEYNTLKNDQKFAERMAFYARAEPGERDNELHSIIGTEVASISPALESYYKRYFTDRQKTVTLYTKYSAVFKQIDERSTQLSASLKTLGVKIEQATNQYNRDVKLLNQDITAFNARANSAGGFSSQSEFRSEQSELMARAANLNTNRAGIEADLVTYRAQRAELESISIEAAALNQSIDSSLAPAPSL